MGYFSWFELVQKTFILRPEQPHIWYLEQKHRKSLQAKASSPPSFISSPAPLQHFLMKYSTSQHFHPFAIKEHLQLKRRMREWKICINPSHLTLPKQKLSQSFMNRLQILDNLINSNMFLLAKDTGSLHLMKSRIVIPINLIPPIHIRKY